MALSKFSKMKAVCPESDSLSTPASSSYIGDTGAIVSGLLMKNRDSQGIGSSSGAAAGVASGVMAGGDSRFAVGAALSVDAESQDGQPEDDSDADDSPLIDPDRDRSHWNHGAFGNGVDEPKKEVHVRVLGSVLYNPRIRAWMVVTNAEKAWYLRRTGKGINIICPNVGDAREAGQSENDPAKKKLKTEDIALPFLPDEMVSKILVKVAFPHILTSRTLNKHWQSNFSTSPEDVTFQEEVSSLSGGWKSYCPVILNMDNDCLMGFDREQNLWMRMSLGLPARCIGNSFTLQKYRGAGSLVCGLRDHKDIFILNLVTRERKWLPARRPSNLNVTDMHLLPVGKDAYQVLVVSKRQVDIWCQVYDSRTDAWKVTHSRSSGPTALSNSTSTFLNGNLYTMEYDPDDGANVMKMEIYSVEEGLWSMIPHPFKHMLHEIESYELLCCRSQVMIVIRLQPIWWFRDPSRKTFRNSLMIYRMDPITLEIREVCRGPPDNVESPSTLFTCDDNAFYFGDPQTPGSFIIEWSLETRQWTCLPPPKGMDGSFKNKWCTFTFQPGMNPFIRV